MRNKSTCQSFQRSEKYIAAAFLLFSVALIVPVLLPLIGITLPLEASLAVAAFGLNGLIPVSLLALVAFPIID